MSASRNCLHVLAVDFLHVEAVGAETHPGVFALRLLRHRVECDGVRIVNQDQVIESEVARERARFRRDALLQAAVARQANDVLIENAVLVGIESRRRHFRRHRDPDRVTDALA